MSNTQEIIDLLDDPVLHRISFGLGGNYVRGRDMPLVATAIQIGQWRLEENPNVTTPYCDPDAHLICLRQHFITTAEWVYDTLHECTHAMLVITGVDRAGMAVVVEVASTLLPIIYLYVTRPIEVRSGNFFTQYPATQEYIRVVERNRMYMTSCILPSDDVNALWRHTHRAMRSRR